ncbi:MAG: hypothetical protein E6H78_19275 [Betaproteobacteria bacterium]|nr:MAG: hypothetical protein E6H78_19275 [Betaproteobacteria bacterium]
MQHAYADAKAAFDRKDPEAATGFERVLILLHDPDLASSSEFADLAVVAAAFRDLSAARETAAAQSQAALALSARESVASGSAPRGKPAEPPVYRDGEPNLTPAVAITQTMPPAHLSERRLWTGAIEILIDETGKVLSAQMATPVQATYDKQLIQAALNWKYRPALKDGMPARYIKIINVRVDSRPDCSIAVMTQCRPQNSN